jgi:hypothetical protein
MSVHAVSSASLHAQKRASLFAAHRDLHRAHFTECGEWIGPGKRDDVGAAREWLWHSFAFLAGDERDVQLANAILAAAPNLPNGFNPIAAAQLLARHGGRIDGRARANLVRIVNDGLPDAIDHSLAVTGVNNFSAMRAMLFLAAAQVLERYDVTHPHRAIPDVYNRYRLQKFGRNVLYLLEAQLDRVELAEEFNSPNYSPITIMSVAEIVNLIDDPVAVRSARRIEQRLWRELLMFHHPVLQTPSGPYARGYEVDRIAHASNWKVMTAFLGLSEVGVEQLLYPPAQGQVIHGGDLVAQQTIACWLAAPDYHVPSDLLAAHWSRAFPFEQTTTYEWTGMGYQRSDGRVALNVEGDYTGAGGHGTTHTWQSRDAALGTMSNSYSTQNVPCHLIYRVDAGDAPGATRAACLVLTQTPENDRAAAPKQNYGEFRIRQNGSTATGSVRPYPWIVSSSPAGERYEYRLELQIAEHLPLGRSVERVYFNGAPISAEIVLPRVAQGQLRIEDGPIRITLTIGGAVPVRFHVVRKNEMLVCGATLEDNDTNLDFQLDVSGA